MGAERVELKRNIEEATLRIIVGLAGSLACAAFAQGVSVEGERGCMIGRMIRKGGSL